EERAGHFFDFGKALFSTGCSQSEHFDRLIAKQIARCVDAVDADVLEHAAAELLAQANITGLDLLPEQRTKVTELAQISRLRERYGMKISVVEVETIRDHKLHVVLLGGAYHRFAIFFGLGHRFFAKDMSAGARGTFGVFAV